MRTPRLLTKLSLLVWLPHLLHGCGGGNFSSSADGSGGAGAAADPLDAAATCTSKVSWKSGENELMRPGESCIACHTTSDGPNLSIAGTVYPSGHEPNDCNGVPSSLGALIIITDARNNEHRLPVNSAGNFVLERMINLPYRAKVVVGGKERAMATEQSVGDCNSCHTQSGANGAPGRITAPL